MKSISRTLRLPKREGMGSITDACVRAYEVFVRLWTLQLTMGPRVLYRVRRSSDRRKDFRGGNFSRSEE